MRYRRGVGRTIFSLRPAGGIVSNSAGRYHRRVAQPISARLLRPLAARDPEEHHRAATPLELLTDLCFVVAIAQAAASFHHEISADHALQGSLGFALAFFAIFLAWLNFTWFASSYDNDDVAYRLLTMAQISGALILAAGIPRTFDDDFSLAVAGYVIMRIALVIQWLRASRDDPERRGTARRYAIAVTGLQTLWVSYLVLPSSIQLAAWLSFAALETLVPSWAERAGRTPWHPQHVVERYGLFFIIVLGETILATTFAIQVALDGGEPATKLLSVVAGGLLIVFSLWWLYFSRSEADRLRQQGNTLTMIWGFGHYIIFGATAAIGAGLAARVDVYTDQSEASDLLASGAVTLPVAIMLVAIYVLRLRKHDHTRQSAGGFACAVLLVAGATFVPAPELFVGVICAGLVAFELLNPESALGRQYAS